MKRSLIIGFSALFGLAAGFSWRALEPRRDGPPATVESKVSPGTAAEGGSQKSPPRPASPLAEKLKGDLLLSDDVTRWLHWMTAVEKAGPGDFPHLAAMARDMPGALNILGARWVEMDSQGLFEACVHAAEAGPGFPVNELSQMLFETWPKKDPDAVFAALRNNSSMRMDWQFTALNRLFSINPEQALITMSDLHIDSYGPEMKGVEKWASEDPRHAAEVALAHPAGYATRMILEVVGKQWAAHDPEAALAFSAASDNFQARELAAQVIRNWVEKDLDKASAWFAAADEKTRAGLLPSFVEAWGKKDAPEALQWCLTNTSGGQQMDVVNALVKGSAAKDPDAAAAMVAGLEASPVRTTAAITLADTMLHKGWWPSMTSSERGASAKPEALAWLGQLDADARKKVISSIQWSWAENDPRGFADYLRTPAGQDADPDAVVSAARSLVRQQPMEALEWASQTPAAGRDQALQETFSNWRRYQPDAAMDWLQKLPAADPRREAFYLGLVYDTLPESVFKNSGPEKLQANLDLAKNLARLLATSPAAARTEISRLTMSDEARSGLLAKLRLKETAK